MMTPAQLFRRVQNKIKWIQKHHWPILRSRLQFLWLLSWNSKPMALSQQPTLIVSPHQDDETLGCGGLIALKRQQQVAVEVAFITDGAASHIWHPQFKNGEIAPVRRQEAIDALALLDIAPENIHFLNHPDGQLKWVTEDVQEAITQQLTERILALQPGEIYVTHHHDRSSDHEIAYRLVEAAIARSGLTIELIEYPIWVLWKPILFKDLSLQELAGARRLPIHQVIKLKRKALAAYRSQYLPIGDTNSTVLPKGFLWRFLLPYEVFFTKS